MRWRKIFEGNIYYWSVVAGEGRGGLTRSTIWAGREIVNMRSPPQPLGSSDRFPNAPFYQPGYPLVSIRQKLLRDECPFHPLKIILTYIKEMGCAPGTGGATPCPTAIPPEWLHQRKSYRLSTPNRFIFPPSKNFAGDLCRGAKTRAQHSKPPAKSANGRKTFSSYSLPKPSVFLRLVDRRPDNRADNWTTEGAGAGSEYRMWWG